MVLDNVPILIHLLFLYRVKISQQIDIIAEIKQDIDRAAEEQDRRKVINWLLEADPSTEQNSADIKHEANTGFWLTSSEDFQNWLRCPNSLYWLNGGGECTLSHHLVWMILTHSKAGSGKTILWYVWMLS